MAYIESFLLYIIVVLTIFLILFIPLVLFIWVLSQFDFFNQKKLFQILFFKKFRFLKRENKENSNLNEQTINSLKSIMKSNFVIFLTFIFIFIFSFSYIKQATLYLKEDRAYPQAKAYVIVGNTIYIIHSALFSLQGINIHENNLDKSFMKVQDFILSRIYKYIPKDDAEREYWLYKYKYESIVTQRYKPLIKKDRESPWRFAISEMGTGTFTPHFLTIMDELHRISKSLHNGKMEDKILNETIKYLTITQMSHYLTYNFIHYAHLGPIGEAYTIKSRLLFKNKKLYLKFVEYINLLIDIQQKIDTQKDLKEPFHNSPFNQVFLYSSILSGLNLELVHNTIENIYPCTSKELKDYLYYHKKFYSFTESQNSSFYKLPKNERKNAKFLLNSYGGTQSFFVIAKYICNMPINYYVEDEKYIIKATGEERLKEYIISGLHKKKWEYEKILKMKENLTKKEYQ